MKDNFLNELFLDALPDKDPDVASDDWRVLRPFQGTGPFVGTVALKRKEGQVLGAVITSSTDLEL